MPTIARSVIDLIGNTPLIRLKGPSEATGCEILAKCEFLNPGQSIKDRAALWIIRDAEKKGLLKPGGTIVEGTAGNTGIGLATVANALGYKCVIVIPRTQSQEKKDAISSLGAELIEVDAVPYSNPNNYVRYSGTLATERAKTEPKGVIWANQFDNVANRQAHIDATGPEIIAQTGGKVDGFICAVGSGGTLAGVSAALKAHNPDIQVGLADPFGAALYSYYTTGALASEGGSITEGIGQGRITGNLEGFTPDFSCRVADEEWLPMLYDLNQYEGLSIGTSSALNVVAAMKLARHLGPNKTVVTVLCDYANRYASKIFNPEFLREKGLPVAPWQQ
jgi:cysteine synthase A